MKRQIGVFLMTSIFSRGDYELYTYKKNDELTVPRLYIEIIDLLPLIFQYCLTYFAGILEKISIENSLYGMMRSISLFHLKKQI